jgi:hypothetical protein
VPVVHGNQAIGAMSIKATRQRLHHRTRRYWRDRQPGRDRHRARLYEQARFRIEVLTQLYNLITVVRSTLELDEVLQATVQSIQRLLKVPGCAIGLIDYERRTLTYQAALGPHTHTIPQLSLDQGRRTCSPILAGQSR